MPVHDAVGINCKKSVTTAKIKAQVSCIWSIIWAKGCILMIVCVCYSTLFDYPSLVEGESYGILFRNI